MESKAVKRQRAYSSSGKLTDTKRLSFDLFRQGKDIDEIAAHRALRRSTIEEHLGHFIFSGEIGIHEIVSRDKLAAITRAIDENKDGLALSPVKQKLGDEYSYGEISAVLNHLKRLSEG